MKILVGLSGGVDSAVAAYLLKQQGHDVTCAFMRNWDSTANNDILGNPTLAMDMCPQEVDYYDALSVANKLGLELLRVDFVKEYWDNVFERFLVEYKKGRTPNPDILCNKYIKFNAFVEFAKSKGFDWVATGHYASVKHTSTQSYLMRAKDQNKDQTYFLSQLPYEALKMTLFPLGEISKDEVRKIALEQDLAVATKKDSTGICFIGERNFKQFLQNYLPSKSGEIVDIASKKVVGKHEGVLYYTIGQRKGLAIGGDLGPWFVIGKDVEKNILYVANVTSAEWLNSNKCIVSQVNWFVPNTFKRKACTAKFRYRQKDHAVEFFVNEDGTLTVLYPQKVGSVTPGQEAVFYDGDIVLGGGVIDYVYLDEVSLEERLGL